MVHIWLVTVMFHHCRRLPGGQACKESRPMTARSPVSRATTRILSVIRPQRPGLPRDIKVMLAAAFLIALGFGLVAPVLAAIRHNLRRRALRPPP